jgi:hypothetical protein
MDLAMNVHRLKEFRAFRPIFAVPFGRSHDWTALTVEAARDEGMHIVLADGGVNVRGTLCLRRIPCDSREVRAEVDAALRSP